MNAQHSHVERYPNHWLQLFSGESVGPDFIAYDTLPDSWINYTSTESARRALLVGIISHANHSHKDTLHLHEVNYVH